VNVSIEFLGGPKDGETYYGSLGDGGEAERYYYFTNHGAVGQRFKVASDLAVETLSDEQLQHDVRHHFHRHYYVVVERLETDGELLIRARYVEPPGTKQPIHGVAEEVSPRESPEEVIRGFLGGAAQSMRRTFGQWWPAAQNNASDTLARNAALHLGHRMLTERWTVFAGDDAAGIDLVALAPTQNVFAACRAITLGDDAVASVRQALLQLSDYWLDSRLVDASRRDRMAQVAAHCSNGYGLIVLLTLAPVEGTPPPLLAAWRGEGNPQPSEDPLLAELKRVGAKTLEPIALAEINGVGAWHYLAAFFPLTRQIAD
jgi:hypothetical protein